MLTTVFPIKPVGNRVVIKREEPKAKSDGGIILPDNSKERPTRGVVMAVGPGEVLANGVKREPGVKVDDVVLFGKYSGHEIEVGKDEYVVLGGEDIIGVLA